MERKGLFTNQFENRSNYLAHFSGTGPEIYEQTKHKIDVFVSASGTGNLMNIHYTIKAYYFISGGTIVGVSQFLKSMNQSTQIVLADPPGSSLMRYVESKGYRLEPSPGSTIAEGIGSGRITANFSKAIIDDAVTISDHELIAMAYYLMK